MPRRLPTQSDPVDHQQSAEASGQRQGNRDLPISIVLRMLSSIHALMAALFAAAALLLIVIATYTG